MFLLRDGTRTQRNTTALALIYLPLARKSPDSKSGEQKDAGSTASVFPASSSRRSPRDDFSIVSQLQSTGASFDFSLKKKGNVFHLVPSGRPSYVCIQVQGCVILWALTTSRQSANGCNNTMSHLLLFVVFRSLTLLTLSDISLKVGGNDDGASCSTSRSPRLL